jgi:hypothetical protein
MGRLSSGKSRRIYRVERSLVMKALAAGLAGAAFCVMLAGCSLVAPVVPPTGVIYTDISAPINTYVANTAISGKVGRASSKDILGLVAWGDASVRAAADEGGLTTVDHIDYEFFNVLFFFSKYTTIVYGQ